MHIEHIALWTRDIERLRSFYETWFGAAAGDRYVNESTGFRSYFLTFPSGSRLEIMSLKTMDDHTAGMGPPAGYAHIAFSTGSEEAVDTLTQRLADGGHTVIDGPRRTGDGYYESVILDPDGNRVEITI
jgi:lactoylglutathione lyase